VAVLCPAVSRGAFEFIWPDAASAGTLSRSTLVSRVLTFHAPARARFSGGELYGVREAAGGSVAVEAALDRVKVALTATTIGSDLYAERTIGVATALSADATTTLAVGVRGAGIRASGVDDLWTPLLDAAVQRRFLERVSVRACWENLAHATIGGSPVTARTDLKVALELDSARILGGLRLEERFSPEITAGLEARVSEWLTLRAGAGRSPGRFGVGLGLGRGRNGWWPLLDLAWQWHPRLGVSSFASITFEM
jgi:hypothetical protein